MATVAGYQTLQANIPPTAITTDDAFVIGAVDRAGTVTEVTYVPEADITGAATNNRTLSVINKGSDGDGTTVVATLTFASGVNATDFDAKTITLHATAANLVVAAGDVLAFSSVHANTGIADPGGLATVKIAATGHSSDGFIQAAY